MGLSVAAMIRVGNQKGLGDFHKQYLVAFSIFLLATILEIAFALIFFLFHEQLPTIFVDLKDVANFTENLEVVTIAAQLLLVAAIFQISDGLQVVVLGALRITRCKNSMYITLFIAYWGNWFSYFYLFRYLYWLRATGIWIGLLAGLTAAALFLFIRFNSETKKLIDQV
ncbi:MAG: MATE family efflux transporter [Flavobacterium haoranii]